MLEFLMLNVLKKLKILWKGQKKKKEKEWKEEKKRK